MAQGIATVIGLEGGAQVGAADHLSTAVAGSELTVGQEMRTDESGRLQVVFADGSSCTLSSGTRVRIDEYSFDNAIARAAAKGFDIDRRKILLPDPLRALGEAMVPVKLHRDVTAQLKVTIIKDA